MIDLPPGDSATLATLRAQLDADPEGTLARARAAWDGTLTAEQLRLAIDSADAALKAGREPGAATKAKPIVVPPEFEFPGYVPDEIPLAPEIARFETWADAPGWVFHTGPAIIGNLFADKAPFRRHADDADFHAVLREPTADAPLKLGLISDFGTGLAHSRYIARHLTAGNCEAVIHLGDVYYAGREKEFSDYFDGPLDPIFAKVPFFGLPGNHEMYSGGHWYFKSIDERRVRYPGKQSQKGSYFSIRAGDFQIIGIDTDYFGHSRFEDPSLRAWLGSKLAHGRDLGCVNILLSGNELHTIGKPGLTSLFSDLRPFLSQVDLMFWGNDHYCAFFDKSDRLPLTSCIGHGGYPYHLKEYGLDDLATTKARSAAPVLFAETQGRYPHWTGIRPEVGNNGFCEMTLNADQSISLLYRDWMGHDRAQIRIGRNADKSMTVENVQSW